MKKAIIIIVVVIIGGYLLLDSDFARDFYQEHIAPVFDSSDTGSSNRQAEAAHKNMILLVSDYSSRGITVEFLSASATIVYKYEKGDKAIFGSHPRKSGFIATEEDWESAYPLDSLSLTGVTYDQFTKDFVNGLSGSPTAENFRILP